MKCITSILDTNTFCFFFGCSWWEKKRVTNFWLLLLHSMNISATLQTLNHKGRKETVKYLTLRWYFSNFCRILGSWECAFSIKKKHQEFRKTQSDIKSIESIYMVNAHVVTCTRRSLTGNWHSEWTINLIGNFTPKNKSSWWWRTTSYTHF